MRYKADTDAVATWLLSTAMALGYAISHGSRGADPAVKGPRLKGKARTLAQASQPGVGINGESITSAYRIKIVDFTHLAEFIVKVNKPRVKVSRQFVLQLRHAIKTRKSHQARYESRCAATAESMVSVCGHEYFIRTLESGMEILRPIMPATSPPIREDVNVGSSPLAKTFEHLNVDEPLEPAIHINIETKISAPTKICATVESTEIGRKQEASIASMCLSRDVHRLRGVV